MKYHVEATFKDGSTMRSETPLNKEEFIINVFESFEFFEITGHNLDDIKEYKIYSLEEE